MLWNSFVLPNYRASKMHPKSQKKSENKIRDLQPYDMYHHTKNQIKYDVSREKKKLNLRWIVKWHVWTPLEHEFIFFFSLRTSYFKLIFHVMIHVIVLVLQISDFFFIFFWLFGCICDDICLRATHLWIVFQLFFLTF